jgi:hypothetical protein
MQPSYWFFTSRYIAFCTDIGCYVFYSLPGEGLTMTRRSCCFIMFAEHFQSAGASTPAAAGEGSGPAQSGGTMAGIHGPGGINTVSGGKILRLL